MVAGEPARTIRRLKPDLAVIDLASSKKSALDLITRVRSLTPPVKLLVVSTQDRAIHAQRVLRAGGDGYILKQEDPLEIINAVRDVLNGRLYVSEAVLAGGRSVSSSASKASSFKPLTNFELDILRIAGRGQKQRRDGPAISDEARRGQ